tara:strand:+ start:683 stop:1927 length:1245 start_codon:yes stop_codon:yes gene_type:complete
MKQLTLALIFLFSFSCASPQESKIDRVKIKEDLNEILSDLSQNYVYLQEKDVDLNCIREYYEKQIPNIKSEEEVVLFFEYLLDEFYDSHVHLNTNTNSSFRLSSPIYATFKNGKPIISNVWQTQIKNSIQNIVEAEILKINGIDFEVAIKEFPTQCNDKSSQEVKEWILNKILAGRYNKPRILTLKLKNKKITEFDLDKIKLKKEQELITVRKVNDIGIIRINNSLGQDEIVNEFDKAIDSLLNTKGLIIDLRNTVNGGDSYEARGIMGRFISEPKPYQMHQFFEESYNNPGYNPKIERRWVEYVVPRANQYKNPVVILVGRWTGSMGEGMAIGFEGMERAEIVGSEMERLAGEMSGFSFKNQTFGYRLSTAKLFHVNGTPREKYVPTYYVKQSTTEKDETLEKGIELINKNVE